MVLVTKLAMAMELKCLMVLMPKFCEFQSQITAMGLMPKCELVVCQKYAVALGPIICSVFAANVQSLCKQSGLEL